MDYNNTILRSNQKYCRAFYKFCSSQKSCATCMLKNLDSYSYSKDCYSQWQPEAISSSFYDLRKGQIRKQ